MALILGLGVCFGINSISGQEKEQPVLQHEVTVTLKLIQVYVTDKEGKPVTDLAKGDFELFDRGKKVDITDFESHIRTKTGAAHISDSREPERIGPPSGRNYFIFFDFSFSEAEGIKEAKKAALDFIAKHLDTSDKIGVISYSPVKKLKIHQFLTDDHETASRAVERLQGIEEIFGGLGALYDETRMLELEPLAAEQDNKNSAYSMIGSRGSGSVGGNSGIQPDNPYREEKDEIARRRRDRGLQARSFADSIRNLAKALAKVQGRKNILFFSSGIPASLFREHFTIDPRTTLDAKGVPTHKIPDIDVLLTDKYHRMVRELAAANCAVFSIYDANDKMKKMASGVPGYLANQTLGEHSLQKLADDTGGKMFNTIRGTEEIMESINDITGSYYVLGYSIHERRDGKFHDIKVSVKRKGCKVHVQDGYYAPKKFSKFSKLERQLHFLDLAFAKNPETPLEFPFTIDAHPCLFKDASGYILLAKLPSAGMKKIAGKSVEITEVILDEAGSVREAGRGVYDLRKMADKDIHFYSGRRLLPGRYTSRIIVRNLETGQAARAETPVVVSWTGEEGISFYKPLLMAPSEEAFYLKGAGSDLSGGKDPGLDALVSVFPLIDYRMVPADEPYRFGRTRFSVMFQCRINGPDIGDMKFDLNLKSSGPEGTIKPQYQSKYVNTGGQSVSIFADVDLLTVPPGPYTMELSLTDKTSGRAWTASVPFVVE